MTYDSQIICLPSEYHINYAYLSSLCKLLRVPRIHYITSKRYNKHPIHSQCQHTLIKRASMNHGQGASKHYPNSETNLQHENILANAQSYSERFGPVPQAKPAFR